MEIKRIFSGILIFVIIIVSLPLFPVNIIAAGGVTLDEAKKTPGVYIMDGELFTLIAMINPKQQKNNKNIYGYSGNPNYGAVTIDAPIQIQQIPNNAQLVYFGGDTVTFDKITETGYTIPYGVNYGIYPAADSKVCIIDYGTDSFGIDKTTVEFEYLNGTSPSDYLSRVIFTHRNWAWPDIGIGILKAEPYEQFRFGCFQGTYYTEETLTADRRFFLFDIDSNSVEHYDIERTMNGYFKLNFPNQLSGYYYLSNTYYRINSRETNGAIIEFVETSNVAAKPINMPSVTDKPEVPYQSEEIPEETTITGGTTVDETENRETKIYINGWVLTSDVEPVMKNDSNFVPIRVIGEVLGYEVVYDGGVITMRHTNQNTVIVMSIGSQFATVDGKSVEMPSAPFIERDRTMVPLRFLSEAMGSKVDWRKGNGDNPNTVNIYSPYPITLLNGSALIATKIEEENWKLHSKWKEENFGTQNSDVVGYYSFTYPVLTIPGNEALSTSFNANVADIVKPRKSYIEETYAEMLVNENERFPANEYLSYTIERCAVPILTLHLYGDNYYGGAHGNTFSYRINIDINRGILLTFADLFKPGVDFENKLLGDMASMIAESQDDYLGYSGVVNPDSLDDADFYFKDGNIIIYYHPYKLASYARGFVEFSIPLQSLADVLRDEYINLDVSDLSANIQELYNDMITTILPPTGVQTPPTSDKTQSITGLVVSTDKGGRISIYDFTAGSNINLMANSLSRMNDKYGSPIVFPEISAGDIVDIEYMDGTIIELLFSKAATEYISRTNVVIDTFGQTISIGGETFKFNEHLITRSRGAEFDILLIKPIDKVTVKIYNNIVWYLELSRGHGSIGFIGKENIIGGVVEINNNTIYNLNDTDVIDVSEGMHKVVVKGQNIEPVWRDVYVERGKTETIDLTVVRILQP